MPDAPHFWKAVSTLLIALIVLVIVLGSPVGAKLTGEAQLRQELRREREERLRAEARWNELIGLVKMQKDVEWVAAWLKRSGEAKK